MDPNFRRRIDLMECLEALDRANQLGLARLCADSPVQP